MNIHFYKAEGDTADLIAQIRRSIPFYEKEMILAFETFIKFSHKPFVYRMILRYLRLQDESAVMDIIERGVVDLSRTISSSFRGVAASSVKRLSQEIQRLDEEERRRLPPGVGIAGAVGAGVGEQLSGEDFPPSAAVGVVFDDTHPRAVEIVRRERDMFIREVSRQQLEAIQTISARAFQEGMGTVAAARLIRDTVGLTSHQAMAVMNYRQSLVNLSGDALTRTLRDHRFDGTVRRAVEAGEPLTASQVNNMVNRYRERFLAHRAETIARTEMLRVLNLARHEALQQVMDDTGVGPERIEREWIATLDARTRDSHFNMDGQVVGVEEAFITPSGVRMMYPGDPSAPAEEVINCRCVVRHIVMPPGRSRDPKGSGGGRAGVIGGLAHGAPPPPDIIPPPVPFSNLPPPVDGDRSTTEWLRQTKIARFERAMTEHSTVKFRGRGALRPFADEMSAVLNSIPPEHLWWGQHRSAIEPLDFGFTVVKDTRNVAGRSDLDGLYKWEGLKKPTLYVANTVSGEPIVDAAGVAIHEYGHLLDHRSGWAFGEELFSERDADLGNMSAEDRYTAEYYTSHPAEFFAEAYRAAYGEASGAETAFGLRIRDARSTYPNTVSAVRGLVDGTIEDWKMSTYAKRSKLMMVHVWKRALPRDGWRIFTGAAGETRVGGLVNGSMYEVVANDTHRELERGYYNVDWEFVRDDARNAPKQVVGT